ncbi:MAG: RNA polymerase sigma factor [Fuerstiella sp.]
MPHESITHELWKRAKEGDKAAFDQLFSIHTERLLVFISAKMGGRLRERIEPQDVLQDAYAAAFQGFQQFDYTDDGAYLRWMCRIIDNRLRDTNDYFAAAKRQIHEIPRSAPTGPVTAFARAENRERLQAALVLLSDEHREVILLRYFQGLTSDEAAERMQRSAGAIRNLLSRALVELGKQMKSNEESHP